jgi:hypothetical protein
MNLTDALSQSRPLPPTQQMAHAVMNGKGSVSVASESGYWDVRWLGCPFGPFETRAEVEAFLEQEGVPLQEGWLPQISTGSAVRC